MKGIAKTDRYVKICGLLKVYGLIKKFKIALMKVSSDKDPEITQYSIFMFEKYNFVLSIRFQHCPFKKVNLIIN